MPAAALPLSLSLFHPPPPHPGPLASRQLWASHQGARNIHYGKRDLGAVCVGPDLASDQGSSREARLCAGLLARALPGPGSGLRKSWESWRELHRHPLKPTSWNGCAVCIDAVSPLRLCARTGAARCPAYLRLACAPQVHRTEGRQSRYHSTQSTVRHLAVFPGAELTSPQNWGQVSWSGGWGVVRPWLEQGFIRKGKRQRAVGGGWGLVGEVSGGKVFGGGVCIGGPGRPRVRMLAGPHCARRDGIWSRKTRC